MTMGLRDRTGQSTAATAAQITAAIAATKLDDLATPDNNTDLNASTSRHGLMPAGDGNAAHFYNGQNAQVTPDHGSIGGLSDDDHTQYPLVDGTRGFSIGSIQTGSGTISTPHSVWNGANLTATFPALTSAENGRKYIVTNIHDTYLTVAAGSGDSLHSTAIPLIAPGETIEYIFLADVWYMLGSPAYDMRREARFFEDFSGATGVGETGMSTASANSGTVTTSSTVNDTNHPGVVRLQTVTSATSSAGVTRSNNCGFKVSGGVLRFETAIYLSDLSDASDEYDFRVGLGDQGGADFVNGIYFEYDRNTNVNWLISTAIGSARTKTDSTVQVAAGAWIKLAFVVNAGGTSVEYFINGVSVGTVTDHIPTTTICHAAANMVKSATANPRFAYIDFFQIKQRFTTAR